MGYDLEEDVPQSPEFVRGILKTSGFSHPDGRGGRVTNVVERATVLGDPNFLASPHAETDN